MRKNFIKAIFLFLSLLTAIVIVGVTHPISAQSTNLLYNPQTDQPISPTCNGQPQTIWTCPLYSSGGVVSQPCWNKWCSGYLSNGQQVCNISGRAPYQPTYSSYTCGSNTVTSNTSTSSTPNPTSLIGVTLPDTNTPYNGNFYVGTNLISTTSSACTPYNGTYAVYCTDGSQPYNALCKIGTPCYNLTTTVQCGGNVGYYTPHILGKIACSSTGTGSVGSAPTINAFDPSYNSSGNIVLHSDVTGATSCNINDGRGWNPSINPNGDYNTVNSNYPGGTTVTFTLTCSNNAGSVTKTTSVNIPTTSTPPPTNNVQMSFGTPSDRACSNGSAIYSVPFSISGGTAIIYQETWNGASKESEVVRVPGLSASTAIQVNAIPSGKSARLRAEAGGQTVYSNYLGNGCTVATPSPTPSPSSTPPQPPSGGGLTAIPGCSSDNNPKVDLAWTVPSNASQIRIIVNDGSAAPISENGWVTSNGNYLYSNVSQNTNYKFQMQILGNDSFAQDYGSPQFAQTTSCTTSSPSPSTTPPNGQNCTTLYNLITSPDHFGALAGQSNYDIKLDLNSDGKIDSLDVGVWRQHSSDESWCANILTPPVALSCSPSAGDGNYQNVNSGSQISFAAAGGAGGYTWRVRSIYSNSSNGVSPANGTGSTFSPTFTYVQDANTYGVTLSDSSGQEVQCKNILTNPPSCSGYSQACTTEFNEPGTQWCTPGVLQNNTCIATGNTNCYKSQSDQTSGCKPDNDPPGCSAAYPQGLQNTGEIGPGGIPVFTTSSNNGGRTYLVITKSPSNAVQNTPTFTASSGASDITFESPAQSGGNYVMNIPANNNTTNPAVYTINDTVQYAGSTRNSSCPAFQIKVPAQAVDTSCPTSIQSTQIRMGIEGNAPWETSKTMILGQNLQLYGAHNNRSDATGDVDISVTGPAGSSSVTSDVFTVGGSTPATATWFTPTQAGTYTITGTTHGKTGAACQTNSTLTVQEPAETTVSYKIADSEEALATASAKPYTTQPVQLNWDLGQANPGETKYVWVQYLSSKGKTSTSNIPITFVGPDPTMTSVDCSVDLTGKGLAVNITGDNFGQQSSGGTSGTVSVDSNNLDVISWGNNNVSGTLSSIPTTTNNKPYTVTLTRPDGQKVQTQCQVGVSQISLGANIFCRAPSNRAQSDVLVKIKEASGSASASAAVSQKVTIDQAGVIQGLTTQLQAGKNYTLSIETPKSLRKVVNFTASAGTTVIPNFVLPIGDIFPLGTGDGVINSADKSELNREWATTIATANRAGDLNQDSKVNSIDWACMRYDFGKNSDPSL